MSEQRRKFFEIRAKCSILVKNHAFQDYPERGFSKNEIVNLVRANPGRVVENKAATAIAGSFLFLVKDDLERQCELVILIEEVVTVDKKTGETRTETIVVCSAYRDAKGKKL